MMNFETPIVLDCENYPNYFLIKFKYTDPESEIVGVGCELRDESATLSEDQILMLKDKFELQTTFGFNSLNYDLPLIAMAMKGATVKEINDLGNDIINQ